MRECRMVKERSLVWRLAVFKDIAPGYKGGQLSGEEAGAKVSAEVEVQLEYEFMLLAQYQKYLQRLHTVAAALNKVQVGGGALARRARGCGLLRAVRRPAVRTEAGAGGVARGMGSLGLRSAERAGGGGGGVDRGIEGRAEWRRTC